MGLVKLRPLLLTVGNSSAGAGEQAATGVAVSGGTADVLQDGADGDDGSAVLGLEATTRDGGGDAVANQGGHVMLDRNCRGGGCVA